MMPIESAAGCMGLTLFVMKGERVHCRTCVRDGIALTEIPVCNLPRHSVLAARAEDSELTQHRFYCRRCHVLAL